MKKVLAISLVLLVAIVATAAVARAREIERPVPMLLDTDTRGLPTGGVFGVTQGPDTFYYGGTVYDAGDARWEAAIPPLAGWANRRQWTFAPGGFAGVAHSGENMDGWKGIDMTADVNDYFNVEDATTIGACVTSKVLFCGLTNAECVAACYSDLAGTGYGDAWNQNVATPSAVHNVGDALTLTYDWYTECEGTPYDWADVILQTYDNVGMVWTDLQVLNTHSGGPASGTAGPIDLASYMVGGEQWRILFHFESDGGWSDEDGLVPTACGAFFTDNVVVAGTTTNWTQDFETTALNGLPAGWSKVVAGCGDYYMAMDIGDLTTPISLDPCIATVPGWCTMGDSMLGAFDPGDPGYPHPLCQFNMAESPVVDLNPAHVGLPGRHLVRERFGDLPLLDHIFMYWQVRYKPGCPAGGWSPWLSDGYVYYTREGASCTYWTSDAGSQIPPTAEEIQMRVGVYNLCDEDPWGDGCTYICNESPYYDNITMGVFGSVETPYISMRELDYWQDQFSEDGTLNQLSTADTRSPNYQSNLVPPIFGDTLVCRGGAANMEVYYVFRMATASAAQPVVHPFFTTWFPGVTGGGWYQARMDTCEITHTTGLYTVALPNWYMCAFHESDPIAIANALPEGTEIMPNQLFVPGTRIEYFLKTNYTGSGVSFLLPDTVNGDPGRGNRFEEFEVLPMMRPDGLGSYEWPCLLVADHFGQRGNWFEENSGRITRHLGTLGYEFDMFNKLGPSSDLRNGIGRWAFNTGQSGAPGIAKVNWGPGATLAQLVGYRHCILNSGNIYGYSIYNQDASMFLSWLVYLSDADHLRTLWVSGDQISRELNRRVPWGPTFLNTVLCATHLVNMYSDTRNDFTYCLPMDGLVGFISCVPKDYVIRQNGCPRKVSVIGQAGVGSCNTAAEVEYNQAFDVGNTDYAAISNSVSVPLGANYKTLLEGYDFCLIRDDASLWPGSRNCGPDGFIATWMGCVLGWFGCVTSECGLTDLVSVDPITPKPAFVTSLGQAFPNPMNPSATINFSIGAPGKVMLRIFDVSGRVIRTLVDDTMPAGPSSATWDGKNDRGERVASGVFFYQLDAPGHRSAKKIVILQ